MTPRRPRHLTLRAGATALARIREHGFDADLFSTLVGASGGPKWLVLSQLDRVLAEHLIANRTRPLDCIGSSIGTFRHACLVQRDAPAAIARLERAYIAQAYETKPSGDTVSRESVRILDQLFSETGRADLLDHPCVQTHVVTSRLRGPLGLLPSLGLAAIANLASRRALGFFFERVVFQSGASRPPQSTERVAESIRFDSFATRDVALSVENLDRAILASGTIPFVMEPIRGIVGAPDGVYLDGGVLDYHFDFTFRARPGLILFPHFFEHITPGWLDKNLLWRRVAGPALDRVLMIAPSRDFVASLPGGRVPDRGDFERWGTEERQRNWNQTVEACEVLADELSQCIASGRMAEAIEPF